MKPHRALWFGALIASLPACKPDPVEVLHDSAAAFERGDVVGVLEHIHSDYVDPLGDRTVLEQDLKDIFERFPFPRRMTIADLTILEGDPLSVIGTLEIELEGDYGLKLIGPLRVELARQGLPLRIRSGWLDDLRDIDRLLAARRAALEANDVDSYATLLHPGYRDGDLDRDGVMARLAEDLEGLAIRMEPIHYRIELRPHLAHVDERCQLRIGETLHPPSLARLTLQPELGRWRLAGGLYPAPRP